MIYYWCELVFDEEGTIRQKNILHSCTEENLVEMLAYLTMQISWQCDTYEDALQKLEKSQNLTGNDCERVILRTVWNSEFEREEVVESAYFLKDKQLVRVDKKHITVTDIRYWHHQVWKRLCSGNWSYKSKYKKSVHQGRTHKQNGHWHWHSGIRRNLQDISEGKVRAKRASKYIGSVDYDPKFYSTENNWKETKVRHQWEWHKKRHQDRISRWKEHSMTNPKSKTIFELQAELDRLEHELDYQVSHKRIAELQEMIADIEQELQEREN